ncbi:MAG: cbb3-type cytochrome c oxidase subunit I, partial [Halorientalis sp.]
VMMGQMQLNMTWHNTFAVPGHFHGTVATGTTLAFMGLLYYVIRLVFGKDWVLAPLARIQPYVYGATMGITVLMMMYLGVLYGVPRRHPSVMNIPGTEFSFAAARPLFLLFGVFALLAIVGGALFVLLAVGSLLFGDDYEGALPVEPPTAVADGGDDDETPHHLLSMRGTFTLTMVFLVVFVVMWALNWFLLAQLWQVG